MSKLNHRHAANPYPIEPNLLMKNPAKILKINYIFQNLTCEPIK